MALLLLLGGSVPVMGQYTVKDVSFSDRGPYSQADLENAAGVHAGQSLDTAGLSAAAQRLGETGAFDDVGATLDGPMKAVTVIFKVKMPPAGGLVRAGFEDFVWLDPAELTPGVHARVPLFTGSLPVAGNLADAVDKALEAMLAEKGVKASVSHELVEPAMGHPVRVYEFKAGPKPVLVAAIAVKGYPAAFAKAAGERLTSVKGSAYNEGLRGETTETQVLTPLLDAGYLDAKLAEVKRTVVEKPDATEVSVAGTVVAGSPYRVSSLAYGGGPLMTAETFAHPAANLTEPGFRPLAPGDVASATALKKTLEPLRDVYLAHGYMDVVVDAVPQLDKSAATVAYTVTVLPGEVYRLRSVRPENLSATALADFERGWLLKPGDVYNVEYVSSFLTKNTALRALQGYSAVFDTKADPETHLVDLTIHFVRSGR